MSEGFLGTAASPYADMALLLEIGMGAALLVGAVLARKRKFRAHAWSQSIVVLLNAVLIALIMVPSFRDQVSPQIPFKLGKPTSLWRRHTGLSVVFLSALPCTFCWLRAQIFCQRVFDSSAISCGCEPCLRVGGWFYF